MGFAVVRREEAITQRTATKTGKKSRSRTANPSLGTRRGRADCRRAGRLRAVITRDARGPARVHGRHGASQAELRRIGQELIDRVTQQYVYHRVVTELKDRNMVIVDEAVRKTARSRFASAVGSSQETS